MYNATKKIIKKISNKLRLKENIISEGARRFIHLEQAYLEKMNLYDRRKALISKMVEELVSIAFYVDKLVLSNNVSEVNTLLETINLKYNILLNLNNEFIDIITKLSELLRINGSSLIDLNNRYLQNVRNIEESDSQILIIKKITFGLSEYIRYAKSIDRNNGASRVRLAPGIQDSIDSVLIRLRRQSVQFEQRINEIDEVDEINEVDSSLEERLQRQANTQDRRLSQLENARNSIPTEQRNMIINNHINKNLENINKIDFSFDKISTILGFELNEDNKLKCKKFLKQILSSFDFTNAFFTFSSRKTISDSISEFIAYLDLEYDGLILDNDINKDTQKSLTPKEKYYIFYNDLIQNPIKEDDLKNKDIDYYTKRYSEVINKFILDKEETKFKFDIVLTELKDSAKFFQAQKAECKDNQKLSIEQLSKFGLFKDIKLKNDILIKSRSL